MQKRAPFGPGPSGNTWPRCASHFAQRTSVRRMPKPRSSCSLTAPVPAGEARPAGAGIEFHVRAEQRLAATDAAIHPLTLLLIIGMAEGSLCPVFSGDMVLLGRKLCATLMLRSSSLGSASFFASIDFAHGGNTFAVGRIYSSVIWGEQGSRRRTDYTFSRRLYWPCAGARPRPRLSHRVFSDISACWEVYLSSQMGLSGKQKSQLSVSACYSGGLYWMRVIALA